MKEKIESRKRYSVKIIIMSTTKIANYEITNMNLDPSNFHNMKVILNSDKLGKPEFIPDSWEDIESESESEYEFELDSDSEDEKVELETKTVSDQNITTPVDVFTQPQIIQLVPAKRPTDTPIFVPNWTKNYQNKSFKMNFSDSSYNGPIQEVETPPEKILNPSKDLSRWCEDRWKVRYSTELFHVLVDLEKKMNARKTRPCIHMLNSNCNKGHDCPFAHNVREFKLISCKFGRECNKKSTCCFFHCLDESVRDLWSRLCSMEKEKYEAASKDKKNKSKNKKNKKTKSKTK